MPAIAPHPDIVVIWKMPLMETVKWPARMLFHGEATRTSEKEAVNAVKRFCGHSRREFTPVKFELNLLDPLTAKQALREYVASQGEDLDKLIEGAAKHFTSSQIVQRTQPFSQEELEFLFEDDQRAFGG